MQCRITLFGIETLIKKAIRITTVFPITVKISVSEDSARNGNFNLYSIYFRKYCSFDTIPILQVSIFHSKMVTLIVFSFL